MDRHRSILVNKDCVLEVCSAVSETLLLSNRKALAGNLSGGTDEQRECPLDAYECA